MQRNQESDRFHNPRMTQTESILLSLLVPDDSHGMTTAEVSKLYNDYCSDFDVKPVTNYCLGRLLSRLFLVSKDGTKRLYLCSPSSEGSVKPTEKFRRVAVVPDNFPDDKNYPEHESEDLRQDEARIELGGGLKIYIPLSSLDRDFLSRLGGGL